MPRMANNKTTANNSKVKITVNSNTRKGIAQGRGGREESGGISPIVSPLEE